MMLYLKTDVKILVSYSETSPLSVLGITSYLLDRAIFTCFILAV